MSEQMRCRECNRRTEHLIYKENLYKYNGERVRHCKLCGNLRTKNHTNVTERGMRHISDV